MLPIIGGAVLLVVGGVLGYASTRPAEFRIERSQRIDADPETVFGFLNDFHRWTAWSPWEKLDPALQRNYGGAPSGKGATYAWVGNKQVGEGRMEILDSTAPSSLRIQLDFLKPWEAHNTTEFTLAPEDGGTRVNWAMYGPNNYMGKVMSLFMNMDRLIGKDFETGLANLRAAAEARG